MAYYDPYPGAAPYAAPSYGYGAAPAPYVPPMPAYGVAPTEELRWACTCLNILGSII